MPEFHFEWMDSNAIVSDQVLAAEATNNGTQDGLMPQPCCNITKHCEPGKLYSSAMSLIPGFFSLFYFLHNPDYGTKMA